MRNPDDNNNGNTAGKPRAKKDPQRSPLNGILEDPKTTDHGVASLDKALWDKSRGKSTPERAAEKED
ncbi:MAG TPA: hypothetical protein VMD07_04415 [Candidatus Acidoferrales bacterium]|nr:hypothetical protein [Candidatus Acidoferrales bacterium]